VRSGQEEGTSVHRCEPEGHRAAEDEMRLDQERSHARRNICIWLGAIVTILLLLVAAVVNIAMINGLVKNEQVAKKTATKNLLQSRSRERAFQAALTLKQDPSVALRPRSTGHRVVSDRGSGTSA